jgi:molybdate transport repressor ModE-like protein
VHFDLIDLRLFASVAEEGRITAAAAHCGLSLPSASQRIKSIEAMLGTPLLERHRRGVRLTPAGHALAHHAKLVLGQMERMRGDLRDYTRGGVRARIRLTANTSVMEEYLPSTLASWLASNQGVDIDLQERPSHQIALALAQSHADIGLMFDLDQTDALRTFPLCTDKLVVVMPTIHKLAKRRRVAFSDIVEEEFVGLTEGSVLAGHLSWHAARLGQPLRTRIRFRGFEAVCRAVERGVGLSVVPEVAARRYQESMSLAVSNLRDTWAVRRLVVCVRQVEALSSPAQSLLRHLLNSF